VQVREENKTTDIWLGDVGRSIRLLIANNDGSEGVLLTTNVNIQDLEKSPLAWGERHGSDQQ